MPVYKFSHHLLAVLVHLAHTAVKWKTNFLILDKSSEGGDIDLPMLSNAEQCTDMCLFIQPVVGRGWDMH